ncbi:MAG TPA: 4Fe-4S binding protein [Blastocatellia bacterium]|nr:4Fe-4S binding protein [Blastocatellia bacterium]
MLRTPILGRVLSWRYSRALLQVPLFLLSVGMILHGLFGPSLAPKNLATTLSWVHFRGALVLVMLMAGNFFCLACPFMFARDVARRFFRPRRNWPRMLRNKWLSLGLFILILFIYELFDLWSSPWWTAWLIVAYFLAALLVDVVFKHASFCKYVCPIGQFNFVASTISPLEVKARDLGVCLECRTKDCIRGRRDAPGSLNVLKSGQRGCELALFQPLKAGNMDCTFCLDCVHACPHDNVGIMSRLPAGELMADPPRSGVGYFSRRRDLATLATVFTFGALLNAFGMVSPVYALQRWLAGVLHLQREAPVLGLIFVFFLVVEPVLLLGLAAWLSKKWGGAKEAIIPLSMRHSYGLVPLGFAVWLSHYAFHFLTGIFTFVPVLQSALASVGLPILGEPHWGLVGMSKSAVYPLEQGFLGLGLLGSLLVSYHISEEGAARHSRRAFAPWAILCALLWIAAVWLMSQPMEMRGSFLGG